mgnify:CR=1 FL=1
MGFCQRCELGHRDSTDHVVLNQVLSCQGLRYERTNAFLGQVSF